MVKKIFLGILTVAFLLVSCKDKTITTQYSVGCLGFNTSAMSDSQWAALEDYLSKTVIYNKMVSYEGKDLSETDIQAVTMFYDQMKKIDTAYVCSLIQDPDNFIYGVRTLKADGTYRILKATVIENGEMHDYSK